MTMPEFNLTTWAGIAAAGAIVASSWRFIKDMLVRLSDFFICRTMVSGASCRAVTAYMWKHGKRSPFGIRMFSGLLTYVGKRKRVEAVAYEGITTEPALVWFSRRPVVMGGPSDPNGNSSPRAMHTDVVYLYTLRGTVNVEALIAQAVDEYNQKRQVAIDHALKKRTSSKRFRVSRMSGGPSYEEVGIAGKSRSSKDESEGRPIAADGDPLEMIRLGEYKLLSLTPDELFQVSDEYVPFSNHPVPAAIMEQLNEVDTWLRNEEWFRTKGVPWRRGYLLYGPPGGGKSTLIRNLAILHDLPIYTFDLSTYNNRTFPSDWQTVMQNAPAIALLEDIDATFNKRENIAVKDKARDGLTFDCLLNTVSGVGTADGVLLFVTTNCLESLDPALGVPDNGHGRSTRPGRIDRAIEVGPMGDTERRKLAEIILFDWPELIEGTVAAGRGEMAAQFQERCAHIAMAKFWQNRKTE